MFIQGATSIPDSAGNEMLVRDPTLLLVQLDG